MAPLLNLEMSSYLASCCLVRTILVCSLFPHSETVPHFWIDFTLTSFVVGFFVRFPDYLLHIKCRCVGDSYSSIITFSVLFSSIYLLIPNFFFFPFTEYWSDNFVKLSILINDLILRW